MGDFSYCEFTFPQAYEGRVAEHFREDEGWERQSGDAPIVGWYNYEVRTGGYDTHESLMNEQIPHRYESGSCPGVWEESISYFIPGEGAVEIQGNLPKALIDENGIPDEIELRSCLEYYRLRNLFHELVQGGAAGFAGAGNSDGDALHRL